MIVDGASPGRTEDPRLEAGDIRCCEDYRDARGGQANEFVEAAKALHKAQQLEPGRWDCYTYQGFLAVKTGDLDGAAASLRKALELNPKHGPTHLILGLVFTRKGKLEAARDEYRLAVLYDTMLSSEEKTAALRAIAEINERLPGK